MSETPNAPGHDHGHAEAEPDNTNVAKLGFFLAITTAVVVLAVWGLDVWFKRQTEALKQEVQYSVDNPELLELRKMEEQVLGSFAAVNEQAGVYRVPVSRGIELFLAEARARARNGEVQRIGPAVPPPGAAPAGAAPAPAPTPGASPAPANPATP